MRYFEIDTVVDLLEDQTFTHFTRKNLSEEKPLFNISQVSYKLNINVNHINKA